MCRKMVFGRNWNGGGLENGIMVLDKSPACILLSLCFWGGVFFLSLSLLIYFNFSSDCVVEFSRNSAVPMYQVLGWVLELQMRYSL